MVVSNCHRLSLSWNPFSAEMAPKAKRGEDIFFRQANKQKEAAEL
jgi:hypothetical protein